MRFNDEIFAILNQYVLNRICRLKLTGKFCMPRNKCFVIVGTAKVDLDTIVLVYTTVDKKSSAFINFGSKSFSIKLSALFQT